MLMGKNTPENLAKILELDSCKASICAIKGITVINNDNFVLDRRRLIREYRKLTGDKSGWFGSLFTGKLKLNGTQIENYQHEYSKDIKNYNLRTFYTDLD